MKKMSLSLLAAGVMAVAGAAHADAIFYPNGTMIDLGPNGAHSLALGSSDSMTSTPPVDTTTLGAGPATTTTTVVEHVYVQPNINWDRDTALMQMHRNSHLHGVRHQAAATFNVPDRSGEASTMTGGAPNAVTDNGALVVGSYTIPYSVMSVDGPYYVFSY
ncbi:hypothetical protein JJB11_05670 [Ramlibacter ginsenosidimutans]|uniref:Uncharacterized protein n=1 Tax=Ramlibacter ginsenosidimutans TaxID=502333 RepID=A0A934TQN2_9BURK|nr:hypothetical protein [Ramlibacter ginsenosidimutans]MBK6005574.1 hypothetical protein [Ramlibacter ginsenosidimutans]